MRKFNLFILVLSCCLLTHGCLAQYKVHVKPAPPPPLAFTAPTGDVTITAGQGFVIGLGFTGGVGPWNCSLVSAPSFVTTAIENGSWCTLRADSTPLPTADYNFNVVLTDSKGTTATVPITVTAQ
jgi:hypothetical protein